MSIVTYGQCGMGKTFTMYANRFDDEFYKDDYASGDEPGIVVRAIDDIFMHLVKRPAGCRFAIKVGWLDLCGDEIVDLLDGVVQCYSIDDVFQCLRTGSVKIRNRGQQNAAVHNIFTIAIEQQWVIDGFLQHRLSTASFCDLAGTERQPLPAETINEFMRSGNQQNGSNYGESVPKDTSLQALERIVCTLCATSTSASPALKMDNGQANLLNQYENTMLTKFLKDSFGGRAQTLMIFCVSPLACDAIETIQNLQFAYRAQFVRNRVILNAFSDNNKPIANYWDAYETPDINLLSKAIQLNGGTMYEKPMVNHCKMNGGIGVGGNCGSGQNAAATAATLAGLKFANSQWLKLVANAETLFSKFLANNTTTLNEQDRECIEQWMFLKRECDDCFGTLPNTIQTVPHTLGPIPEKSEPGENGCSDDAQDDNCNGNSIVNDDVAMAMQRALETDGQFSALNDTELDNESDMDQFDFLPERISELMQNFSCKMNEIVEQNYEDFVQNYPKGVMQSVSDDDADKQKEKQQPAQPPSSPADNATAADNLACVETMRSNSVILSTEPTAYPTGRRRSIHAAAAISTSANAVSSEAVDDCSSSAIPNTAQLARLNRLADECIQNSQTTTSSTNTVCREINDFLDNSDELHPLRMANRNRGTYETAICRLQSDIEAKEKQQHDLLQSIKERTQLMKQCQPGKQSLKQREEHLRQQKEKCEKALSKSPREKKKIEKLRMDLMQIQKELNDVYKIKQANRDTDTTIRECEQYIEKSKKQLASLKKDLKNQKKALEKLQTEFIKSSKGDKKSSIYGNNHNIDTHITQLDCVLKEKRMYLQQQTSGESQFVDSLRHEIRNLRSQRERLNEQQWACYQKLNGGNQLDRQFLQYDVAKEVIDYAIEYKNQLISNKKAIFIESPDLMNQLKRLSEKEMRIVLYKCLQKIVDLRKSTGFVENELIRLEKELDKSQLRERTLSQQFQQFRLKTNGYTLSLENQYDKLLRVYLQGAAGMPMRNENAAAPLLMSPSHILRSKHHQHYRHQQQRATINQIEYNLQDNGDEGNGDENHRRNANQQRHPYRLVNPTSALVTATPSIESATAAAATATTTAAFDPFQKQKPQKFHSLMKLLKQSPLMLTNHSHSPVNAEHGGKVTVDKNNKKIFIQQNKPH